MSDEEQTKSKKEWMTFGLIIAGLIVVLIVINATSNDVEPGLVKLPSDEDIASLGDGSASGTISYLSGPQTNAARSARQYLSLSGFSRAGLIQQLSSDYGDRYSVADATAAVDSLDVDWNEQAVRSAKQYLSLSGFSCDGLVEQLSSDVGDKYTPSQAAYGARQAGAC